MEIRTTIHEGGRGRGKTKVLVIRRKNVSEETDTCIKIFHMKRSSNVITINPT